MQGIFVVVTTLVAGSDTGYSPMLYDREIKGNKAVCSVSRMGLEVSEIKSTICAREPFSCTCTVPILSRIIVQSTSTLSTNGTICVMVDTQRNCVLLLLARMVDP